MYSKIVVANWKMNTTLEEGTQLAASIMNKLDGQHSQNVQVVLAPPSTHLYPIYQLASSYKGVYIGAQNCHTNESGAFTGEISAPMLHAVGVTYVIIGHSERRKYFKEDGALLAEKVTVALAHHLQPIFCCGEDWVTRDSNGHIPYVMKQLEESLCHLTAKQLEKVIVAYEPIWAIGTGRTPSPLQIATMHTAIYTALAQKYSDELAAKIPILYGGSCNQDNAQAIFACDHVAGGLIGGASLQADNFVNIINSFN